jgi:hypothetical protein
MNLNITSDEYISTLYNYTHALTINSQIIYFLRQYYKSIKWFNMFKSNFKVLFLNKLFNKKMVKSVIYMLFSYQTVYIMWHSRLMLYIPFGCASGNIDHKPGMSHYIRHNLCHWTVSSEDSCTRCTNWVVGVDLWKVYFNFLLKKRIFFLFIQPFWVVLFVESNHLNYPQ